MNEYDEDYGLCPYCGYELGTPAESSLHMQPGSYLANRYLIGKVIGFGGFGVTYIAWDTTLKIRVAIKEYLPSEFATRAVGQTQVTIFSGNKAEQFNDGMKKFLDEAQRLKKFQDEPGIVRIYDSFEENNTAYIVMEYLDGETLTSYLERNGKIPVGDAITMLTPIFESLENVHKVGIIHRDIAPDNIMITKDNHVKLIDFGAARYATTSHSRSLTVIIKAGYSPEEQYRSRGDQGAHTDVYALAAVLYRMITGITPPDAMERKAYLESRKKDSLIPPSKNCKITKNQENAILNAMNIRIEDRTKTADEFLKQLTSKTPVQRVIGKVKTIDIWSWPIWAKIGVPVGGAVVIALFVLLFTGQFSFVGNLITDFTLGEGMTRVPSVINYSTGVAQDMLDGATLSSVISGREISENVPANMVLRQGPTAGEVTEEGSIVELYVSSASELEIEEGFMPDVSYYPEQEAREALESIGAVVRIEEEFSSDVAEGLVIRANVGYGEPLSEGDEVTLYVSKGPDPDADENSDALKLNRSSLSLFVGDSVTLSASGGSGTISWSSSNPGVASVSNGNVIAISRGSTTITAMRGDETVTCAVTVQDYTLSLSESSVSLFAGGSTTISAYGAPSGVSLSWSSSNSGVATVSGGTIRGVSTGSATITASFSVGGKNYTATCRVTVTSSGVTLSRTSISSLYVGESETISASTSPQGQTVTWRSSNTNVATVSNGRITAVGEGSATITASFTYGGQTYSETCSVTVREVSVRISNSSLSLQSGDTERLTATTTPSGQSVTWSSSNSSVATVSSNGQVTAVGSGTATITARITVNGKSYTDTCSVTVTSVSVSLSKSSLSMTVGDTESLTASVSPGGTNVAWSSSNTSVATVSGGSVNAVGEGSTTITAAVTYGGKTYSATCSVTVRAPSLGIMVEVQNSVMDVGQTQSLRIITTASEVDSIDITSSNTNVVTVNKSSATITAVGGGTATITVTITRGGHSNSSSCTVTVKEQSQPNLVAPRLTLSTTSIDEGESFSLSWTSAGEGTSYYVSLNGKLSDGDSYMGSWPYTQSLSDSSSSHGVLRAGTYRIQVVASRGSETVRSNEITLTVRAKNNVSISWAPDQSRLAISSTNATIALTGTVSGASTTAVTSVGATLYDSQGNYLASASESVNLSVDYNYFNVWYDINSRMGYTLSSNTKYIFTMYAVIDGTTYISGRYSFTTR